MEIDATEAALKVGALRRCPRHPDVYLRNDDPDAEKRADAIWTNMLKRDHLRFRREYMDTISAVIHEAPYTCFICDAAYEKGDE